MVECPQNLERITRVALLESTEALSFWTLFSKCTGQVAQPRQFVNYR
jgi:hypothetical protein